MIESITLVEVASYGTTAEVMSDLRELNYVFGTNGCGKTTIGRVIADRASHASCPIAWKGNAPLETLVYNRDFVERSFSQSAELKGVFTLGEQNIETLQKIKDLAAEVDALTKKLEKLGESLGGADGAGGKTGELDVHETAIRDQCWLQKQKHDKTLQGAFVGVRDKKESFKARVLQERSNTKGKVVDLATLEKRASTVFGEAPTAEAVLPMLDGAALAAHESAAILKKRVIGKADVDIAAMIKKLGNSDWVREGRTFLDQNEQKCPFCQQQVSATFEKSLAEYFDEAFEKDSKAIESLCIAYKSDAARLQQEVAALISAPSRFLDVEKLKLEKQILDSTLTINLQRLDGKRKEPSTPVILDSLQNVVAAMIALINDANKQIASHNLTVKNLSAEKAQLTHDVWKFVVTELQADLTAYDSKKSAVQKAIDGIRAQIEAAKKEKAKKEADIRSLEKTTTSVQPTIDAINALLGSFGFSGFSLKASSGNSYKLVRADGSDAKATLSEGEKTFVTFLYFYHLLKGSDSQSGITRDRVVVFDDPVSSLDSDVLFIVGSLIKGLFDEVRNKTGHIKQIFVLTHNVYFHKEVTFNPNRRNRDAMKEETFWVVRKADTFSKIERHLSNPIKTSYELLWGEVRSENRSRLTIQNTLRRILENYFKILGGINPDHICDMFQGKERLICKSLFSWVNDGSHYAHDDLYVSIDESMVQTYLNVFREIFVKAKHEAHFNMMMGLSA
ncbi:hypothetical protein Pan44_19230 [Caulifigura coniformis]|uniref:Protein CR006 P-loop domain-containing protein n=1 Tax=Caulifigura coniformis TaxID=2527983 RepID=A0A517SCP2_9PLAN|nr:AAA family ATPase [Caulifigura coniformis]QDT53897.1 hypothetical protein Pan44_19230 [Caulifigura coniformis]